MAVQAGNMVLVEVAVLVDGVKLVAVEAGLRYSQAVERAVGKATGHVGMMAGSTVEVAVGEETAG